MSGAPVLTTITETDWVADDSLSTIRRRVKILGVNAGHPIEEHGLETMSLFVPASAFDELFEKWVISSPA
jgi:hypothetical protein